MPSISKKQHNFMEMVAHNPAMAKKVGVPQSVGKDFAEADKGKKFGTGGSATISHGGKGQINKQQIRMGSIFGEEKNMPNVNINKYIGKKEGGMAKDMESKSETKKEMAMDKKQDVAMIKKAFKEHDAQEHKGGKGTKLALKKGGMTMKKMAMGGMSRMESKGEHPVQKRAKQGAEMVKMAEPKHKGYEGGAGVKMAKGGLAAGHKSADGCAVRGKTRAMAPGMKKGGKC